jgi:hypothetical protein
MFSGAANESASPSNESSSLGSPRTTYSSNNCLPDRENEIWVESGRTMVVCCCSTCRFAFGGAGRVCISPDGTIDRMRSNAPVFGISPKVKLIAL